MSTISHTLNIIALFCSMALIITSFPVEGSGTEDPRTEDWPMFRLDILHTGCKEGKAPDTNQTDWIFDTGTNYSWVVSSPMVVDDYVYIGSDNAKLYKLNLHNGTEVWNYTVRESKGCLAQFWSSPCVDKENGMVFVHANGVHAIDMETGERIWHFQTMNREFCSPVVYNEMVFVGSYNNHLYCLPEFDPNGDGTIDDDEIIWYYKTGEYKAGVYMEGTGGAVSTTVAIANDMIFAAEQTHYNEGTTYCDYNIFVLPVEDPNHNGVISHSEIIWKYKIGEKVPVIETDVPGEGGDAFSSPTINLELGQVYIGSRDQYFYAFDLEHDHDGIDNDLDGIFDNEGTLLWKFEADNEIFSSASYHNGTVFFGSGEYSSSASPGSLYALPEQDPNGDGEISPNEMIWRYQNADGILSSPLIADGKVFIGTNDGKVYAFDEETGEMVWEYKTHVIKQDAVGSSPSLYEERLVVGCCNGMVYSFLDRAPETHSDDNDDDIDAIVLGGVGAIAAILGVVGAFLFMRTRKKIREES